MKISNAARLVFWVIAVSALGFLVKAESGQKRAGMPDGKSASLLRIVDQNGRPVVSGVPSGTRTTFDVTVGPDFAFHPDTINISVGDTVRWTWAGGGHSVSSGPHCIPDSQFCSPNDMSCFPGVTSPAGTMYQHTFDAAGSYSYICIAHCAIGMTGVVNVSGGCSPAGWSAGQNVPSVSVRNVGVYFQANGKFYVMGGRSSDVAGSDFTHPFEYDPATNAWITKSATYPDNQVNNMACGVLVDAGTPYIYCVGGSAAGATTSTDRVFRYNPVTDAITSVAAPWPGALGGTTLPGGFSMFNNKLYILGGFTISPAAAVNTIWEFTPTANTWAQKAAVLPAARAYIPTATIGDFIYTGGGSDVQGGLLVDATDSFKYNPAGDSISTIASIPRATGETRALNFNGLMLVMGGGRTAPNPSNEVDIYNPGTDAWTTGSPVPAFTTARRNFPTDTDGTSRIWLAGGYAPTSPTDSTEIFCSAGPTPTPTATPTATATATATATPTATATASGTPTATPSATATATGTPTATPSATATATGTPSGTRPTPTPRTRPTPAPRP